ncbi:hypothetical protein [Pseudonocardia cypriaca]|uniref:Uncharacterized protein n=1 Tax=Pseudonocardia cypriaca TaxID=882449 RepID=A0A543FXB2_9PSEU|nr:hypothetical protein [Pseudonocardia cypriaca]TQM38473.1 hypothetical protein FB388_5712 [Pseudonocardia cypriaca]
MSEHPAGRETSPDAAGSPLPAQEEDGPERADGPGETVGASDAAADAARSGADVDVPDDVRTDSDPVPVGDDDADADARRSGGHR